MRLQQLPALRAVYKLKHDWTQYMRDMKEIMVPSSMPDDPPITATLRRQPWEIVSAVAVALKEYAASWRSTHPDGLEFQGVQGQDADVPLPHHLYDDLSAIGSAGAGGLKPALQHLYRSRLTALQSASTCFLQGYREGAARTDDS